MVRERLVLRLVVEAMPAGHEGGKWVSDSFNYVASSSSLGEGTSQATDHPPTLAITLTFHNPPQLSNCSPTLLNLSLSLTPISSVLFSLSPPSVVSLTYMTLSSFSSTFWFLLLSLSLTHSSTYYYLLTNLILLNFPSSLFLKFLPIFFGSILFPYFLSYSSIIFSFIQSLSSLHLTCEPRFLPLFSFLNFFLLLRPFLFCFPSFNFHSSSVIHSKAHSSLLSFLFITQIFFISLTSLLFFLSPPP